MTELLMRVPCWIVGHHWIRVEAVGLAAKPGGMLPLLDGYVTYAPDPNGTSVACVRCRRVKEAGR